MAKRSTTKRELIDTSRKLHQAVGFVRHLSVGDQVPQPTDPMCEANERSE